MESPVSAQILIDDYIQVLNSKIDVMESLDKIKDARIKQLEENLNSTEEILAKALTLIESYSKMMSEISKNEPEINTNPF